MNQVSDIMTKNTVSFSPSMPAVDALQILFKNNMSGAPVIDIDSAILGVLKESDFVTKDTNIHLPTFLKLFEEFGLYRKDKRLINKDLLAISLLRVRDIMSHESPVLTLETSIKEAAKVFAEYPDINPIPVVNSSGKLAGVLNRHDLIKSFAGDVLQHHSLPSEPKRQVDNDINTFLKSLKSRFIFVSKRRIHLWVIFSIVCMIVGFLMANFLLLRINF